MAQSFWRRYFLAGKSETSRVCLNGVREQTHIFIHFDCKRTIKAVEDEVIIHREYSCTFWHNKEYATESGIEHKALMRTLNNVLFTDVPLGMPYWVLATSTKSSSQLCERDTNHPSWRLKLLLQMNETLIIQIRLLKRTLYRIYKRLRGLGYSVPP